MVVDWEQEIGFFMSLGDVWIVWIWDIDCEMKVQDIFMGVDSCVMSLFCDFYCLFIVVGFGDGFICVYDRRMVFSECCVMMYWEYIVWVVKVFLQKCFDGYIVSVSVNGDVCIFDFWMFELVNVFQIVKGLIVLDIYFQVDLIVCGFVNQFIVIYNGGGELINNIKYYDGFMGQWVGVISCLVFYLYWFYLVVGSNDYYIFVYLVEKCVRQWCDLGYQVMVVCCIQ